MKSVIAFFSVAILATTIHAGAMTWGCVIYNSANEETDGWATIGTTYTLYYFGDVAPVGGATVYDLNTGLTDLGGTIVDTYTLVEDNWDSGMFSKNYGGQEIDINGYYTVLVYDPATPDVFDMTTPLLVSGNSTLGPATILQEYDELNYNLGTEMHGTVIPEPSSLALLAFGVAALGLRRKVAK